MWRGFGSFFTEATRGIEKLLGLDICFVTINFLCFLIDFTYVITDVLILGGWLGLEG